MSISPRVFSSACERLHNQWKRHDSCKQWRDVKVLGSPGANWMRITRPIANSSRVQHDSATAHEAFEEPAMDEPDDEALPARVGQPTTPLAVYDIVHSPSYQVPVLYITFNDLPARDRGLPSPDLAYQMLVPTAYRSQLSAIGPTEALSMTDHPVTSTPAYFVHPCRTAEAMGTVGGSETLRPEEYLLRWIGLVGHSVGLNVPVEVAEAMAQ